MKHRVIGLKHGVIALRHGVIALRHRVIALRHGVIALRHGVIALRHRVIALRHRVIALKHTGIVNRTPKMPAAARGSGVLCAKYTPRTFHSIFKKPLKAQQVLSYLALCLIVVDISIR